MRNETNIPWCPLTPLNDTWGLSLIHISTSLTQNVKDLLDSSEIENILENSDFVLMLNQGASDRNILAQRLGISPQELNHVTNSGEGEGLLFFGDKIIPFEDKFPRNTQLYRVMTTKPSDLAA